jgi:hypothetical protein
MVTYEQQPEDRLVAAGAWALVEPWMDPLSQERTFQNGDTNFNCQSARQQMVGWRELRATSSTEALCLSDRLSDMAVTDATSTPVVGGLNARVERIRKRDATEG